MIYHILDRRPRRDLIAATRAGELWSGPERTQKSRQSLWLLSFDCATCSILGGCMKCLYTPSALQLPVPSRAYITSLNDVDRGSVLLAVLPAIRRSRGHFYCLGHESIWSISLSCCPAWRILEYSFEIESVPLVVYVLCVS